MAARQTFVAARESDNSPVVQPVDHPINRKSFVPPVSPFAYGQRLRREGYGVWHCTSIEMERGWLQAQ